MESLQNVGLWEGDFEDPQQVSRSRSRLLLRETKQVCYSELTKCYGNALLFLNIVLVGP